MSAEYAVEDDIIEKLSFLIERDRFDQAEKLLGQALKNDPDNPELLHMSAYIDFSKERYEASEETLKAALEKAPHDEAMRTLLFLVYFSLNRYADAEMLIIELIKEFPRDPEYYSLYAELMLQTLHVSKAKKLTEEALRLDPSDSTSVTVRILCDLIHGKIRDADQEISELVQEDPESGYVARNILLVLLDRKKYKEALALSRQILRSDPNDQDVIDLIKELRVETHPTMLPLYPLTRYGWPGSATMWVAAIGSIVLLGNVVSNTASVVAVLLWLIYVGYSWLYPPFLRWILR